MSKKTILDVKGIDKSYKQAENQELLVLRNVNFSLEDGEIVALLGKSGSGKSTLLRIVAGLIESTSGEVNYRGRPVYEPVQGITMVFQHFALMPWLTVLQNVELGLEAQGVPRNERRTRALKAIDTIGLDGFESAYPKELSGGMRQRVGIARALVVNPDILLMDEPFSALDVLTSENLRRDLLDLWQEQKTDTKGILFVTHNIEEAVAIADRIVIVGGVPGTIAAELPIKIQHPRDDESAPFRHAVDEVYTLMTTLPGDERSSLFGKKTKKIDIGYRLPEADISELGGLLETLHAEETKSVDLPALAEWLHLDIDNLFPITEILEILGFAKVSKGDIAITEVGKAYATADILERKKIFLKQLIANVPLAEHIRQVLDHRAGHRVSEERFLAKLEDYLSESEAERVLKIIIDWGRYAELFAYDANTGMMSLENPD